MLQPDLDCTSPQAHDWRSGAGEASSARRASHCCCSVVTKALPLRHERHLEMSDVVDAADDHTAAAPFEQRHRRVLDSKWEQTATRSADDAMQRHLNHASMCDDEHIALRMVGED